MTDEQAFEPSVREWPEETVEAVRVAEAAAQRSVCVVPDGDLPDELAQALERRVEVNLAQYDGGDIVRVGSADLEVRRVEAPFTRRRAAERPTKDDGHRRRSTRKKTTKKGQS